MPEPIPFTVTRHRCPFCPRTGSSKARATDHIARCWSNPETRGCKTCAHFEKYAGGPTCFPGRPCDCNDGYEQCAVGISLTGRPACERCGGHGEIGMGDAIGGGMSECPECSGDGHEIKPGPIVHCGEWEVKP
jgi:hypothetical protein